MAESDCAASHKVCAASHKVGVLLATRSVCYNLAQHCELDSVSEGEREFSATQH